MAKGTPSLKNLRRGVHVYRVLNDSIEHVEVLSTPMPYSAYLRQHEPDRYHKWKKDSRDAEEFGLRSLLSSPVVIVARRDYLRSYEGQKPDRTFVGDLLGHDRHRNTGHVHSFFTRKAAERHIKSHYIPFPFREYDGEYDE